MPTPPSSVSDGTPSVVCAGLVVADHVTPPLERWPAPGELVAVDDLVLNIGGGAANTAVDLARLGVKTAIRARVGDDIFGRFITETLNRSGVDCAALQIDPHLPSSQTLIINVRGEDRRFIHTGGANNGFVAADLDAMLARPPKVLHIGYFLILPNLRAEELAQRFQRARAAGTVTLLDVATPGPGAYVERLRAVLPHTDVFVPNADEARLILGEADPVRQAAVFRAWGARRVIITMGGDGLVSFSEAARFRMKAHSVTCLDGTGGGDAFNAGYILGLLENRPEIECLRLASAVGASCVRVVGATQGVFARDEAEAFLRDHETAVEPIEPGTIS